MNIENIVRQYISDYVADKIGGKVGLSQEVSRSLVDKVITAIMGAVRESSAKAPETVPSLFQAVSEDHDGSIFDRLDDMLLHTEDFKGDKILRHVLGGGTPSVRDLLAESAHVKSSDAQKVMEAVAPLVMGVLGKAQHEKNLDLGAFEKLLK